MTRFNVERGGLGEGACLNSIWSYIFEDEG